jgi:hypothetical protein
LLGIGGAPPQTLSLVPGGDRPIYANAHFAWHSTSNATVLTDVDRVQPYACQAVSPTDATVLSHGRSGF